MKRVQMLIMMMVAGILITACNAQENNSTKTYVKDLVATDVFETLSEDSGEVLVYEEASDIEGEYFELATVNIQQVNKDESLSDIVENLKRETMLLGGNGILVIEKSTKKSDQSYTKEIKAIAVYTFDENAKLKELAAV